MKRKTANHAHRAKIRATLSAATALDVLVKLSQFSTAVEYQRAARRDEARGFPLTAAYELRHAAELFVVEPSMADRCWKNWERLMGLPRELSRPIDSPDQDRAAAC